MAKKRQNGSGRKAVREAWQQQSGGQSKVPGHSSRPPSKRTSRPQSGSGGAPEASAFEASAPEAEPLPSQAEGDRAAAEEAGSDAENQVSLMDQSAAQAEVKGPKPTPSQAEGERKTVDDDLREKGLGSQE